MRVKISIDLITISQSLFWSPIKYQIALLLKFEIIANVFPSA